MKVNDFLPPWLAENILVRFQALPVATCTCNAEELAVTNRPHWCHARFRNAVTLGWCEHIRRPKAEPEVGIEPTTYRLQGGCSTN